MLFGSKPPQRFAAYLDNPLVATMPSCEQQRLRQSCIRVRETCFKPMPILRMSALIDIKQSIGQQIASTLDDPVAWKPVQVCLHTQERERPRAGAGKSGDGGKGLLKQPTCRAPEAWIL